MKIVLAPDSFKGTIRSQEACRILTEAMSPLLPDAEFLSVPLADGGEGSLDAVAASGGEIHALTVRDPLGRPVNARFLYWPDEHQALVEMAEASGLERLQPAERHPLLTSTYGTGELLHAARLAGAREIIVAIGGSATVDGGLGMALALGADIATASGKRLQGNGGELPDIQAVKLDRLRADWQDITVRIASDVTNPLLGPSGAAKVFGPQKGATPAEVVQLNQGLENWSNCLRDAGCCQDCTHPGDGAAGGLGFALRVLLNGTSQSGARLLASLLHLPEKLRGADLLITGEGRTDTQTAFGKLPAVAADIAKEAGVPTILLSGALDPNAELGEHFLAAFATVTDCSPLETVLASSRRNLARQAANLAALLAWKINHR